MLDSNASTIPNKGSLRATLLLAAIGGAVVMLGVAGGIRLGLSNTRMGSLAPASLRNTSLLSIGEFLPDYYVKPIAGGSQVKISEMLHGSPALIVIASETCSACDSQFRHWKKKVVPSLTASAKIVVILDEAEYSPAQNGNPSERLPGAVFVLAARDLQADHDGIEATPTTIGVDSSLRIKFIMSGNDPRADAKFLNEQLES